MNERNAHPPKRLLEDRSAAERHYPKRIVKIFRRQALRELKKIKLAWPDLNYSTAPGLLILLPSAPAIPPPAQQLQLVE